MTVCVPEAGRSVVTDSILGLIDHGGGCVSEWLTRRQGKALQGNGPRPCLVHRIPGQADTFSYEPHVMLLGWPICSRGRVVLWDAAGEPTHVTRPRGREYHHYRWLGHGDDVVFIGLTVEEGERVFAHRHVPGEVLPVGVKAAAAYAALRMQRECYA